ncbi:3'(2'),5'-bisphosphate nucleotidase CysQ [Glaciecola petra]|uniref:3'(2'),5'-bisphosphate nucleotidase CysQ n=1 Tax=Glaciecola petra TaxID=3075602 RepID=A0ABU2ZRS2_9ALTE|nr:3'(2'),5'-bisphosphate nucleotidase CysQ [Aestuariibacter sp. P117]MDT0594728.1 3'(2'),5'-bisphosphate nucleotidase CysQ [Aestuariibacter sp. P117]
MSPFDLNEKNINILTDIAIEAGHKILAIYKKDFDVYKKDDSSPLTEADLAAHHYIVEQLQNISNLPILSEEASDIDWETRKAWTTYWLLDPLDGTKEFIKKNGEFTVNIALVQNGEPIFGVVHAPALATTYFGGNGIGAFELKNGHTNSIAVVSHQPNEIWRVVGSRSHQSSEIEKILTALPGETELVAMGSSLKLCCVASGKAHLYPRVGPTSEWDTAAAHAVVLGAGGTVKVLDPDKPFDAKASTLRYNQKESLLNPFFMVSN